MTGFARIFPAGLFPSVTVNRNISLMPWNANRRDDDSSALNKIASYGISESVDIERRPERHDEALILDLDRHCVKVEPAFRDRVLTLIE
jgi:hypothetical protein